MLTKFLKLRFDLVFFYVFVFLLPLEKKHVFLANITNLSTNYSPWGAIELYLTDIVFGLVLLFWLGWTLIKAQSAKHKAQNHPEGKFSVSYGAGNLKLKVYKSPIFLLLTCFFLATIISTIRGGVNQLELYHLTRLGEYILLFTYIILNIDTIVKSLWTIGAFLFSSLLQAILGIFQYFAQHSFNLKIFGEVDLSPYIQNVAKIVVDGEKYIRAYGTLPHANILGGYLFVAFTFCLIIILITIYSLGSNGAKELNVPCGTIATCWERLLGDKRSPRVRNHNGFLTEALLKNQTRVVEGRITLFGFLVRRTRDLLPVFSLLAAIIFLGLILSFSRSAWLALICALIILAVMWGGLFFRFLRKAKRAKIWLILLLSIPMATVIFTFWPQIKARTSQFDQYGDATIAGRTMYNKIAFKMVQQSPLFGVGYGNFVANLPEFDQKPLAWWQNQPAHNIYLLALAETGLLGFLSFLCFLGYLIYLGIKGTINSPSIAWRMLQSGLLAVICGLFVIGFLDHYLWDIQQGGLLFWLVLGLFARSSTWNNGKLLCTNDRFQNSL